MKTLLVTLTVMLASTMAFAQDAAQIRKLFEAGKYDQVIDAGQSSPHADPDVIYAAAQSAQKLGNIDSAREFYERLSTFPEENPWHFVGVSGRQLLADETDEARNAAQQAVERGDNLAEAHYQLGLVLAKRQDWNAAAAQFDRAAELNPSMAYAHYYGGLMHYRANRPDRMANHFEYFLKLAPEAPERPEVMQIMKTVRGR
jgi:tetratricopeptide (TPR) repeat protein